MTQVVTEPEHDYFRVSQKELARLGPQPTMWRLTGALRNITGAFAVSADDTIAVAVLNDFRPGTMVAIRLNAAGASGPPEFVDAQPGDLTEAPPVAATGSTVFVLDHPRSSGAARVSAYDI